MGSSEVSQKEQMKTSSQDSALQRSEGSLSEGWVQKLK